MDQLESRRRPNLTYRGAKQPNYVYRELYNSVPIDNDCRNGRYCQPVDCILQQRTKSADHCHWKHWLQLRELDWHGRGFFFGQYQPCHGNSEWSNNRDCELYAKSNTNTNTDTDTDAVSFAISVTISQSISFPVTGVRTVQHQQLSGR
jgi:hypothetical protein